MYLAKNLKFLRMFNKESQGDLAKKLNKSQNLISNWENEERNPTVGDLLLICRHYNVSIEDLHEKDLSMEFAKQEYPEEELSRNEFIEELKELLNIADLTEEKKKYIKKTIKMIMEDDE